MEESQVVVPFIRHTPGSETIPLLTTALPVVRFLPLITTTFAPCAKAVVSKNVKGFTSKFIVTWISAIPLSESSPTTVELTRTPLSNTTFGLPFFIAFAVVKMWTVSFSFAMIIPL